jgi:protein-tyrosine phosphatase
VEATNDLAIQRPFSVLFVCTANQCRSPLAENLFRASLQRLGVDWQVSSAGVRACDGKPMHRHVSTVLDEHDIPHQGWQSRRLTPAQIAATDLVLTAEVVHRQVAVTMHPAAVRYSFTLLQFARLLKLAAASGELTSAHDGPDLIRHAELARSRPQSRDEHLIDLPDPIGESIDKFRETADRIEQALGQIEHAFGGEQVNVATT